MGSCARSVVKELAVEFSPTRTTWSEFSRDKKCSALRTGEDSSMTASWDKLLAELSEGGYGKVFGIIMLQN